MSSYIPKISNMTNDPVVQGILASKEKEKLAEIFFCSLSNEVSSPAPDATRVSVPSSEFLQEQGMTLTKIRKFYTFFADKGNIPSMFEMAGLSKGETKVGWLLKSNTSQGRLKAGVQLWNQGDKRRAEQLLEEERKNGSSEATYLLARLKANPQLLTEAANAGHTQACFDLSIFLREKNKHQESNSYLKKAADLGHALAQQEYGNLIGREDPEQGFHYLSLALENGILEAGVNLGVLYEDQGNYAKALELYQRGVEGGLPDAMGNLSILYRKGLGVEKDLAKAFELTKKAAEIRPDEYANDLGHFYLEANDVKEALRWFERSAKKGDILGSYSAAIHHSDPKKKLFYAKQGAEAGDLDSMILLAELYAVSERFDLAMNWWEKVGEKRPDALLPLIAHARALGQDKRALEAAKRAAEKGSKEGRWLYGCCLESSGDKAGALAQFLIGANAKDVKSQFEAARILLEGADPEKGRELLEKAAAGNHPKALLFLAKLLEVEDPQRAVVHYRRAGELGSADALFRMGEIYQHGQCNVVANGPAALQFYRAAAKKGHVLAMYVVALSEKDVKKMTEVADTGHLPAMIWLGQHYFKEKNNNQALAFFRAAADGGDRIAAFDTAKLLSQKGNEAEAFKYVEIAASGEGAKVHAILSLARCYLFGRGTNPDVSRARVLLQPLVDTGNPDAEYLFACIHNKEGNDELAIEYSKRAADHGFVGARSMLGSLLLKKGETERGVAELRQAADSGHVNAQLKLFDFYVKREEETRNREEGMRYLLLAVQTGNPAARGLYGIELMKTDRASAFPHLEAAAETGEPNFLNALGVIHPSEEQAFALFQKAGNLPSAQKNLARCYELGYGTEKDEYRAYTLSTPEEATRLYGVAEERAAQGNAERELRLKEAKEQLKSEYTSFFREHQDTFEIVPRDKIQRVFEQIDSEFDHLAWNPIDPLEYLRPGHNLLEKQQKEEEEKIEEIRKGVSVFVKSALIAALPGPIEEMARKSFQPSPELQARIEGAASTGHLRAILHLLRGEEGFAEELLESLSLHKDIVDIFREALTLAGKWTSPQEIESSIQRGYVPGKVETKPVTADLEEQLLKGVSVFIGNREAKVSISPEVLEQVREKGYSLERLLNGIIAGRKISWDSRGFYKYRFGGDGAGSTFRMAAKETSENRLEFFFFGSHEEFDKFKIA